MALASNPLVRELRLSNSEPFAGSGYARAVAQQEALYPAPVPDHPKTAPGRLPSSAAILQLELGALLALTGAVLLIHGYHPWSDDAAIYISGLRKMIDPSLYPHDAAFVLAHTRVSAFAHLLAALARTFHFGLQRLLFASYLLSALLFLYACRRFALSIFRSERASWIATLFATACFTIPVAGTALFLMDPYLSARSFSTPLSILAATAALERRWTATLIWTGLTIGMHPQMGVYAAGFVVILILVDRDRLRAALALSAAAVAGCGVLWLATRHVVENSAAREAVLSRTYFFPARWQWYEILGLVAPLLLFAIAWWRTPRLSPARRVAAASVLVGSAACIAAFSFVHTGGPYFIARLQLLRNFQVIYALGLVLLGGFIARSFAMRRRWIPGVLVLGAAAGMYWTQLQTYPGSAHLEWPGSVPVNSWGQALVWIRNHTPQDAVFAISPDLLADPAEDLPGFRALSERSVLVDNKDEGVASIFPKVAPAWQQRSQATASLDRMSPADRVSRLQPWGVSWLLLSPASATALPCPYRNSVVAVCPLMNRGPL